MDTRRFIPTLALIFCTMLLLLAFSPILIAQSDRARIVGTVTDPQGAVVPGASVTATNVATGVEAKTTTNQDGYYQALELPIGAYKVKVQRDGFKTTETAAYTLDINQVQRVDVKLPVGVKTEIVEVSGEAAQVETVNPTLGAAVTGDAIQELPLNGRNVLDLALLMPGVMPHNMDDNGAGSFNIAGARADSVTFLLDGGVDNNLLSNGVVYVPNPDAVEEFRILTSNYTAEFGRNAGGIVSLAVKSGTNNIHGSVFEYNRNDALAANSYFNNKNGVPKDILKRNQYGFSAGGPVIKNKLFWFTSFQGQKQNAGETDTVSTLTPAMLQGDFSRAGTDATHPNGGVPNSQVVAFLTANPAYALGSPAQGIINPAMIDPAVKKYIAAGLIHGTASNNYSCVLQNPTDPTSGECSGILISQGSHPNNFNDFTGKMDFNPTERDHFSATIGGRRQTEVRPFIVTTPPESGPGYPNAYAAHHYFSGLSYTRTFSNSLLNEFRFTLQRNANRQAVPAATAPTAAQLGVGITPDQATGPPRLTLVSGLINGFSVQGPTSLVDDTFAYTDTVSWSKGKHSMKFGGGYLPYENNTLFDFFVDGEFLFDSFNSTFNQYANMLLGMPETYLQFGSAPSNIRQKATYAFAQDEWHVTRNLTLTFGTRYEYSSPKIDTRGRSFSIVPGAHSVRFPNAPSSLLFPGDPGAPLGANFPDKNDWAPRIGFAWDPFKNGKTSIRGGAGMFYDVLKGEDNLQFNGQAPFFGFDFIGFPDCSTGACSTSPGFLTDPFGTTGSVNTFPSRPPASNIDFGASGFLPFGGGGVFFVDPHLRTPYIVQFNLDIQRELVKNMALEVGYVGSQARKLTTLVDNNPFDPATLSKTPKRILNEIPGGSFSFTPTFENAVNANYNALQTKLTKRTGETRYLGSSFFTLAYTWAHSIDNSSGFRNRNAEIPFFQRNVFRASSDFDLRQQLTFSGGWELPLAQAWTTGPKRLTKGWNLYPIISWHSGFPMDVSAGLSDFGGGPAAPGPSGEGDNVIVNAFLTGPVTYHNPDTPTPGSRGNQYFSGNFSVPKVLASGAFPITGYGFGRNRLRGPDTINTDMAMAKKTAITENINLELRADFFNLFNHAEFNNPDTTFSSPTFGQVTTTAAPRIIQLAARITF